MPNLVKNKAEKEFIFLYFMISKSHIKLINALRLKKYRKKNALFVVEGPKMLQELLQTNLQIEKIFALPDWLQKNQHLLNAHQHKLVAISAKELSKIAHLTTPNQVLAIVDIPRNDIDEQVLIQNYHLALDNIRDPGNLGTIIRMADWFGIPYIFCTPSCVDAYNPKVVQASMGSIYRIKLIYTDLGKLFGQYPQIPVFGALLKGKNVFETDFFNYKNGFLLIGSESHGIQENLMSYIHQPITILRYGQAESLNAAMAAGIICAAVKR